VLFPLSLNAENEKAPENLQMELNNLQFYTGILLKQNCNYSSLFWNVSQRWMAVSYPDVLGQPIGLVFKDQAVTGGS
jgi:hypothetical protein